MAEPQNAGWSLVWRWLRIIGLSLVMMFLIGFAGGFVAGHIDEGGGFSLLVAGVLALVALCLAGSGWLLKREIQALTPQDPLTAKERLNRNILVACGLLGGVIGAALAITGDLTLGEGIFSSDPLPAGFAIVLVLVIGVLLPAISLYWHRRAIDEQEADAYKSGALIAMYVYMIGAPVWWFAWRGGFAPEPSGVAIYMVTITVLGAVWLWKKYG